MKKMLIFFIFYFYPYVFTFCQVKPQDILMKSFKCLDSKTSTKYDALFKNKYLNKEDTNIFKSSVYLLKNTNDTFLKSYVLYECEDSIYKIYDLKNTYVVIPKEKKVEIYDSKESQQSAIFGNIFSNALWMYFIYPERLKKLFDSGNFVERLSDTLIENINCFQVRIRFPDDEDISNINHYIFINKNDFVPIFLKQTLTFQGNIQYKELYVKNYKFECVNKSQFSTKSIPKTYKKVHVNEENTSSPINSNGIVGKEAKEISGKNYKDKLNFEKINFNSKITVLDFWYISCHPCVKAIPIIEKLRSQYDSNKVNFFGLNTIDNNTYGISKLPKFLKYNLIGYPIILIDSEIAKQYNIKMYPTFFIINQKGNIVFQQEGFSENLYETLKGKIDYILK